VATVIKKCGCTDQRRCKHGWVVRYRANGRQHEKTFPHDRKTLANDLAAQVEHEKRSGDYVDPKAARSPSRSTRSARSLSTLPPTARAPTARPSSTSPRRSVAKPSAGSPRDEIQELLVETMPAKPVGAS
jgi:hypothetical protein